MEVVEVVHRRRRRRARARARARRVGRPRDHVLVQDLRRRRRVHRRHPHQVAGLKIPVKQQEQQQTS